MENQLSLSSDGVTAEELDPLSDVFLSHFCLIGRDVEFSSESNIGSNQRLSQRRNEENKVSLDVNAEQKLVNNHINYSGFKK